MNSIHGHELQRTDGFTAELVNDFFPGTESGLKQEKYNYQTIEQLIANNEYLIFDARNDIDGFSLWRTDGNTQNFVVVFPHETGPKICIENNLYFAHANFIYKTTGKIDENKIAVELNIPPYGSGELGCYQYSFFRINNEIGLNLYCNNTSTIHTKHYYIDLNNQNSHLIYISGSDENAHNFISFDSLLFFEEAY